MRHTPNDDQCNLEPCPNCHAPTYECFLCDGGIVTEAMLVEYRLLFGTDTLPTVQDLVDLRRRHKDV